MDDLLTTRQLKDLLQVDRITIYRMLNDGRLRGFKVGGQWRFSRREIEAWLEEQQSRLTAATLSPSGSSVTPSAQALSLSCVQAIQGILAEAVNIAVVTTDLDGAPLTSVSNSCDFCSLILASEEGRRRCAVAWSFLANGQAHACHAGLLCTSAPIKIGDMRIAITAGCQFVTQGWATDLSTLAAELGLDPGDLKARADSVRTVSQESLHRISRLLQRVADTFAEIGEERLSLLSRLQHIAEMSKI